MATPTSAVNRVISPSARPFIGGTRFDLLFGLGALWYVTGAYLDSWAHNNIPQLETFWTPWHGVFYAGVLAILCLMFGTMFVNRQRGAASWQKSVPAGYMPTLIGICGMPLVGAGDALWHTLFGIERNIDALFSPTHLLAMICSCLVVVGPLRAISLRKTEPVSWKDHLWLAVALTFFYALVAMFSQGFHPFERFDLPLTARIGQNDEQLLAIGGFILQMGLFTGCALYVARRWMLRFGFFTFVLTVVAIGLAQMQHFQIGIGISLVAGFLIDGAYFLLKPGLADPLALRMFALAAAMALPATYLLGLRLFYGPLAWSIHMVTGSVAVCGMFAWLLSYVMVPAQQPSTDVE
jgi:hypothetical protein